MRSHRLLRFIFFVLACSTLHAQQSTAPVSRQEQLHRLQVGIDALQRWYVPQTGLYQTTGWWNSANAITMLVDAMRVSGVHTNDTVLANTLIKAQIVVPKNNAPASSPR